MKNKIFIKLCDIALEVEQFLKTHPRISRKKKPNRENNSPQIKHIVRLFPIKKQKLSDNF